jgi:hypothetical protein
MIRWWLVFAGIVRVAAPVQHDIPSVTLWWAIATIILVLHERVGFAAVGLVGFAACIAHAPNNVAAIAWTAVCMALFLDDEDALRTALRSLTIVIYAFAAVNKLLFGFLSGEIIRRYARVPLPSVACWPLAVAAVVAEAWLAWAVWRRSRWALPVAVALHAGIVVWSGYTTMVNLGIAVAFNGLLVLLVRASVNEVPTDEPASPGGHEHRCG